MSAGSEAKESRGFVNLLNHTGMVPTAYFERGKPTWSFRRILAVGDLNLMLAFRPLVPADLDAVLAVQPDELDVLVVHFPQAA